MIIKQGKTNWKFLLIVVILAAIVGGGVLYCQYISVECNSPTDCEGKTHIMCVGQWECISNQCSWDCEIEETEPLITREEALIIAQQSSDCSMAGILTDEINYNAVTKTWWIDLERMPELEKDGCNPACVVNETTKTAEVNWRCTGLLPGTEDETADCLKKYPVVVFEDCVPGEVVDGWWATILYPNTLDTSNIEHYIDAPAPDIVRQAGIARYGASQSTCQTSWSIKINGEWKKVDQIEFCNYIIDYNSSCNDCLLEWGEGCC